MGVFVMADYKVCVVGDLAVGKSSLSIRKIERIFVETYDPTLDDLFKFKSTINNVTYCTHIYDTVFHIEEARPMEEHYYKACTGFILVYSVTSRSSFDLVGEIYREILEEKKESKISFVLVGNKCDLQVDRQVDKEEGEELAKILNCPFFEASAKDDINVDALFDSLVKRLHESENVVKIEDKSKRSRL